MGCFTSRSRVVPFQEAIATISLDNTHLAVLHHRYLPLVDGLKHRSNRLAIYFHGCRGVVTVGSLIVPALLSVQYNTTTGTTTQYSVYWLAWIVSLIVTICNGIFTLFKLDKRYYLVHTTLEQAISEGWQFVELSGKYSGFYTPGTHPNHTNQFKYFCHAIEKLRMSQVEQEYYKLTDGNTNGGPDAGGHANHFGSVKGVSQEQDKLHSFLPPTPLKEELAKLPTEVVKVVKAQLSHLLSDRDAGSADTGSPESSQ